MCKLGGSASEVIIGLTDTIPDYVPLRWARLRCLCLTTLPPEQNITFCDNKFNLILIHSPPDDLWIADLQGGDGDGLFAAVDRDIDG